MKTEDAVTAIEKLSKVGFGYDISDDDRIALKTAAEAIKLQHTFDRNNISDMAYFEGRCVNKLHSLFLSLFRESGLSAENLAERTGKNIDDVRNWIGSPGDNIEADFPLYFRALKSQ